jgi:hypothetical protein
VGQKRNPKLVAIAKRLRNAGHSYAAIADELSKQGKSVSKASVIGWLRAAEPTVEPPKLTAPPPPAPVPEPLPAPPLPAEPDDDSEAAPEELRRVLTNGMRTAQAAADRAADVGDAAEAKAQAKLVGLFAGHLRQIHSKADEDTDTIKIKAGDMAAAAEKAVAGLHSLAERVVAEVQTWPSCPHCGAHRGAFAVAEVSPLRAMFERVARGGS